MARRLLAALLLLMALLQLSNFAGFVDIVDGYQLGPTVVTVILAGGLLVGEAAAGIGLLARRARTPGLRRCGE